MPGPPSAVAATRKAVRAALTRLAAEGARVVIVACSGGADSLALADAVAFEAPKLGLTSHAVVIDHGLQADSGEVAASAAAQCRALGLDCPAPVRVAVALGSEADGPEAAARQARYAALEAVALDLERESRAPVAVLLGHTRNDQAEQVLLGLARGSGARSLAGMPSRRGRFVRPFLALDRATTESACAAAGLTPWKDPHNEDPAYTRVRARRILTDLEDALGPGIAAALARTADLLRADADHLDALADQALATLAADQPVAVADLITLPDAIRTRVWRLLALRAGARANDLSATHVARLDALITDWHGQGPLQLPGPIEVARRNGRIVFAPLTR